MITVTFLPILFSGVVSVIIGSVWYSSFLFGRARTRLANLSPEQMETGKARTYVAPLVACIFNMLVAYVMVYFAAAWGVYDWVSAIELGFWIWVGFIVPSMLGMVLWDRRPVMLYLINIFYWLVVLVVIAIIVTYGEPSAMGAVYSGE
jgi:hypothetical protein